MPEKSISGGHSRWDVLRFATASNIAQCLLLTQSGHWPFEFAVMHNRSGGVVGFKRPMSAFGGKADIGLTLRNVR